MKTILEKKLSEIKDPAKAVDLSTKITRVVVRYSVKATVAATLVYYIPYAETKKQKLQFSIAVWSMTGAASESSANWAADYVEGFVEKGIAFWKELKNRTEPDETSYERAPEDLVE